MMNRKITGLLLLMLILLHAIPAAAQEWNQWRGADRSGTVNNFAAPASWPKTLTQKWKAPVGNSYSSPVVSQSRIYVHTRRDEQEVVSCLDLGTGKMIWSQNYAAPFAKNQYAVKMGKGPNSTPVVYDGKLYTLGVTAILSCFDAKTGTLKWRKDYSQFVDTSKLFCGTAMSPVVDKGNVMVHVGDDRKGWVIAFDAASGKEKWKWEGEGPGYASPIVVDLEGTRQMVTLTDKSVVSIATDSGKLLWQFPHKDEWNENIITPVLYQKSLIISGVRQGTRAIKISKTGESWAASQLWHNPKVAMYMSSPVLDGDYLYGLSTMKKGQFFCLNAQTGDTVWTTEGRNANNAAVVGAKNFLFLLTEDAELLVTTKNTRGFESVARYTVADSPTWSHPVILGKQLLVKDEANLIMWSFE
jgi:outer membrane protein assembly factor BamB